MDPKRSKQFVINKMIETGLIASKDEILPSKRKRAAKSARNNDDDADENTDHEEDASRRNAPMPKHSKRPVKMPKTSSKSLNTQALRTLLIAMEAYFKPVLEWLEESLNDAAADLDEDDPTDDPDDCVPLVPFTAEQRAAFEGHDFQQLLNGLGLQEPTAGVETYWRIPHDLTASDLRRRARIVGGLDVDDDAAELDDQTAELSDAESEDYDFDRAKLNRVNTLVYNASDDDETAPRMAAVAKVQKKGKFNIADMAKGSEDSGPDDEIESEPSLATAPSLLVDGDSDSDADQTVVNQTSAKRKKRAAVIESDDDDDHDAGIATSVVNAADSSGEIMDSLVMEADSPTKAAKRIRSAGSDESDKDVADDQEVVVSHQVKRKRAVIISDDED